MKRNQLNSLLFALSLFVCGAVVAEQERISLGDAADFNAVIFGDFSAPHSDVEGRLAVQGNVSINNYSLADKLSADTAGVSVVVGGDFNFPSGKIYYGHILTGGSAEGVGNAVRHGLSGQQLLLDQVDLPVDFVQLKNQLEAESSRLATLTPNGSVVSQWGGLYLEGDCQSPVQVFSLNGQTVLNAHTFQVSCIPANSHVVLNISGTHSGLTNMSLESLKSHRQRVLFNFYQAASLKFAGIGVEGSILAPNAEINQPQGVVHGTVIAKSFHGMMQLNHVPFDGLNTHLSDCDLNQSP